jgi:hypothetical protein
MLLLISLVLALVPLLGVLWIVIFGSPFTVDGLFMALILLAMSGIFALNVLIELRKRRSGAAAAAGTVIAVSGGGLVQRGKVLSVQFFESLVGQPNKSIVTLSNGANARQMLVLEGDARNALPVGRRVEITFRKNEGQNVLVDVIYA